MIKIQSKNYDNNTRTQGKSLKTFDSISGDQKLYKSVSHMILFAITICFSSFYQGYTIAYFPAFAHQHLNQYYGGGQHVFTGTLYGFSIGVLFIGAFIGTFLSYIFLKYFSRKSSFLAVNCLALFVGLQIFIPDISLMFFCRICQGIAVGIYSIIIPVFISQFMPHDLVQLCGTLHEIFLKFGIFFAFFISWILYQAGMNGNYFYVILSIPLFILAIQTILLIWVFPYQTPVYLIMNNRIDEARHLIKMIYKQQFVDEVLKQKKQQATLMIPIFGQTKYKEQKTMEPINFNLDPEFQPSEQQQQQVKPKQADKEKKKISKLKKKRTLAIQRTYNLRTGGFQKNHKQDNKKQIQKTKQIQEDPQTLRKQKNYKIFAFFSIFIAGMEMVSGMTVILSYILQLVLFPYPTQQLGISAALFLVLFLSPFLTSFLLKFIGRKEVLLIGQVITCISLILLTIGLIVSGDNSNLIDYNSYDFNRVIDQGVIINLIGIFIFMCCYGMIISPVTKLYVLQITQAKILPFTILVKWGASAILTTLFPILHHAFPNQNPYPFFIILIILNICGLIVSALFGIETSDKSLLEIRQEIQAFKICKDKKKKKKMIKNLD